MRTFNKLRKSLYCTLYCIYRPYQPCEYIVSLCDQKSSQKHFLATSNIKFQTPLLPLENKYIYFMPNHCNKTLCLHSDILFWFPAQQMMG